MDVQFRRSGTRRYGVTILRPGLPPFTKDPAPGFDEYLPHDLIHFIVERELGLTQGIFGQVAAGGTGGTFLPEDSESLTTREASRRQRSLSKRSEKLMRAGRRDTAASEEAVYVVHNEWKLRRSGKATPPAVSGAKNSNRITTDQIARMCDELDELSQKWVALKIGEAITLTWPKS
ncbi:MAG TPA: hypothetical protein VI306_22745 [Pyrinomonadaceae bacterium]